MVNHITSLLVLFLAIFLIYQFVDGGCFVPHLTLPV